MLLAALSFETGRRPRVLLVEDHDDTRQMYAEFLQSSFEVETAPDAPTALLQARLRLPDVLVTDLSLPGMDGFALTAAIRADRILAGIRVLCLSGFGGAAHEARARAAGCDRTLQKPCMPDALASAIAGLLSGGRPRPSKRGTAGQG